MLFRDFVSFFWVDCGVRDVEVQMALRTSSSPLHDPVLGTPSRLNILSTIALMTIESLTDFQNIKPLSGHHGNRHEVAASVEVMVQVVGGGNQPTI